MICRVLSKGDKQHQSITFRQSKADLAIRFVWLAQEDNDIFHVLSLNDLRLANLCFLSVLQNYHEFRVMSFLTHCYVLAFVYVISFFISLIIFNLNIILLTIHLSEYIFRLVPILATYISSPHVIKFMLVMLILKVGFCIWPEKIDN